MIPPLHSDEAEAIVRRADVSDAGEKLALQVGMQLQMLSAEQHASQLAPRRTVAWKVRVHLRTAHSLKEVLYGGGGGGGNECLMKLAKKCSFLHRFYSLPML